MDCAKYHELLSDFCDGALDNDTRTLVQTHLKDCLPCDGINRELDTIVRTAIVLRSESDGISFPDEEVVWQRLNLSKQIIH